MGRRFSRPRTFDCSCTGSHTLSAAGRSSRQLASARSALRNRHFCRCIGERHARQAAYGGVSFIERVSSTVALPLPASLSCPLHRLSEDRMLHHERSRQAAFQMYGFNERSNSTALLSKRCFIADCSPPSSSGHCFKHRSPQTAFRPTVSLRVWDFVASLLPSRASAPKSDPFSEVPTEVGFRRQRARRCVTPSAFDLIVWAGRTCLGLRRRLLHPFWPVGQLTGILMQPRVFSRVKEQCRQALSPLYLEPVLPSSRSRRNYSTYD